jgi:CRP/FNR family transcriptional regulator
MQKHAAFDVEGNRGSGSPAPVSLASLFHLQPAEAVTAGKALFWEGDAASHLFEITEGIIRLYRIIGEGRRVITAFLFPGDLVGASLQERYLYTAEAVVDCRIRRVSRKNFHEEIARSPCLRPDFISLLCHEMAAAHDQMVLLSKKNAEERLCSFFLQLMGRDATSERAGRIGVPMNRLDIADYLGLTIETVSRTITKLANRGVLAPAGRHEIRILNPKRLVQLSGNGDDFLSEDCHSSSVH